jgi:hypothetical protein
MQLGDTVQIKSIPTPTVFWTNVEGSRQVITGLRNLDGDHQFSFSNPFNEDDQVWASQEHARLVQNPA